MATYEAYVTLGKASIAVSTVEIPLSVRSETGDVIEPIALLTLMLPASTEQTAPKPRIRVLQRPAPKQNPKE